MDYWFLSPFMIPIVAIVSGCVVAIVATVSRNQVRALEIRERIAMIERGLVPPPEVDPRGFDHAMNRYGRRQERHWRGGLRRRRSGILAMAVGFALMALIGIAGESPREALGIGGAFVIFGLAFLVSSFFEDPQPLVWDPPFPQSPSATSQDAPPQWKPPSSPPGSPA